MMRRFWESLNPRLKRWAVLSGGALGLGLVISLFTQESRHPHTPSEQAVVRHVLTDRSTQDLGIESVAADVKQVAHQSQALQQELAQLKAKMDAARDAPSEATENGLLDIRAELNQLRTQLKTLQGTGAWDSSTDQATGDFGSLHTQKRAPLQIIHHTEVAKSTRQHATTAEDAGIYLPSGALLTGVLLTGLDAPTHQGARRDPFPATLRIQKNAILPNRFRADVRECFLIVSGYGDLSSERAYLRGETFSCVRQDGGVVESKLDAYAVGEDGKAGVRGRLVSKQGQIIAKSMMAGFLSGLSKAFDVNPVPAVNLNPGNGAQYQPVFSQNMLQGAAVKGASAALDRVAQFYIDMAENLFPVIEVDAGRQIDVVLTRGAALRLATPKQATRR